MTDITLVEAQKRIIQLIADNWELVVDSGAYVLIAKSKDSPHLTLGGSISLLGNEVNSMSTLHTPEELTDKILAAEQYFNNLKKEI